MEQKVEFSNKQGNKLVGILLKPKKYTEKCIILCHGITVDKDEYGVFIDLANELVVRDFAVFRFDFSGHGESEGKSVNMTPMSETQDIDAALSFLEKEGYKEFGIVGASFGGGVVSLFAGSHPTLFKAIVLWNPLVDYGALIDSSQTQSAWYKKFWGEKAMIQIEQQGFAEVGSKKFKIGKDFLEEIRYLKPWQSLDEISSPILFVHGTEDTYVPYNDSLKYSKMFDKQLLTVEGAGHGFHDNYKHEEQANKATVEFFLQNM